ncbi:MAG: GntR family transcriptional regulator [Fimbriimonas sp.]|nr:GntR family transcriptional regulator [Fimbriimonas sp.]
MEIATTPTVQSAIESVRQGIRNGDYRAGGVLPAESDLAITFGVSRGTVRRAIEAMVETGELVRRPHSRTIVNGYTRTRTAEAADEVQVWISHPISDEPTLQFLKGISLGLAGSLYRMVVREPSRFVKDVVHADERRFFTDMMSNERIAGAIIQRDVFANDADLIEQLVQAGHALVFVDSPAPNGIAADHVGTANVAATRRCIEHLLELGHTRIACLADTDIPFAVVERIRGYRRAMSQSRNEEFSRVIIAEQVSPADPTRMPLSGQFAQSLVRNPYFVDKGSRLASAVLAMDPLPSALFICYDILAYWTCAFLEGAGIRIPEQMSVVGFDWIAGRERGLADELTTANQDFAGFGRHAADLLIDRITGQLPPAPRHVQLDAPLVIRSSTLPYLSMPGIPPANRSPGKDAPELVYETS